LTSEPELRQFDFTSGHATSWLYHFIDERHEYTINL
jgi:hypothetical protein